jgi:hypothetical protein
VLDESMTAGPVYVIVGVACVLYVVGTVEVAPMMEHLIEAEMKKEWN